MSSFLDDRNKQIQKAIQKTNDLIELVSLHHLLAVTVSSLPSAEGAEERKRMAALQAKIETFTFDIMKAAKLHKNMTEGKGDENRQSTGFTLLCNNLREALELFRRDLFKLIFIQYGLSNDSSGFLMWEGIHTGFHCSAMLHDNIKSAKSIGNFKEDGRTHGTRMTDVMQKISIILNSLLTNVPVHVWTIENYSSIDMHDWDETVGKATCFSGISLLIRKNLKIVIGIAAFLLLAITLAIVVIILLIA